MNKTKVSRKMNNRGWAFAGLGLAAVVLTVNVGFILASTTTNPGLVNDHYEDYGSKQYLIDARYRNQMERGWHLNLRLPVKWQVGKVNRFSLTALNKDSTPILGGRAEMAVYRPSDIQKDIYIEMAEDQIHPGTYLGEVSLPVMGTWDMNLLFKYDNKNYLMHKRIKATGPKDMKHQRTLLERVVSLVTPADR
jgi:hypothetical protein